MFEVYTNRLKTTMATLEEDINIDEEVKIVEENFNSLVVRGSRVHRAKIWRYDPQSNVWSESETLAYVGDKLELGHKEGACRDAYKFEYLNQDETLGRYVGKQYKLEKYRRRPKTVEHYKTDVISQMTSRYYATLFNQKLYSLDEIHSFGQVQFLPAVLIELSDVESETEKYYNVEPYMAGDFRKITNNLNWTEEDGTEGKDFLLAFSHFSYCESNENLIVVDIQGWTSQEKKGVTFLTDPQIHKRDKDGKGPTIQGMDAFQEFWKAIHPSCNDICKLLNLKRP